MAKQRKKYTGARFAKNPEAAKRYRVYYYRLADTDEYAIKQDTSWSTNDKAQAFGLASFHVAKAELAKGEYAKAIVIDAHMGRWVRVYTLRPGQMIHIKEY